MQSNVTTKRQQELIEIAWELFANQSYAAVTTAMIAERAGVSEPIIYKHFRNKEHLYHVALEEAGRIMISEFRSLAKAHDGALATMRSLACSHLQTQRGNLFCRLFARAIGEARDSHTQVILREMLSQFHGLLVSLFAEGLASGELKPHVDESRLAWFTISQSLMLNVFSQLEFPEQVREAYAQSVLEGTLKHALAEPVSRSMPGQSAPQKRKAP